VALVSRDAMVRDAAANVREALQAHGSWQRRCYHCRAGKQRPRKGPQSGTGSHGSSSRGCACGGATGASAVLWERVPGGGVEGWAQGRVQTAGRAVEPVAQGLHCVPADTPFQGCLVHAALVTTWLKCVQLAPERGLPRGPDWIGRLYSWKDCSNELALPPPYHHWYVPSAWVLRPSHLPAS